MSAFGSERERALEAAAREYGRELSFGDRSARTQIERRHADLQPELSARLDDVERLLGTPKCPHSEASAALEVQRRHMMGREWRTEAELFGWPLVHVATGLDPDTGKVRVARGVIAIGGIAVGGITLGGMTVGGISIGGVSLGLLAFGGCAAGGIAIGGVALGVAALGGLAVGVIALGGLGIGHWAAGGEALGTHVLTPRVQDPEAKALLGPLLDLLRSR